MYLLAPALIIFVSVYLCSPSNPFKLILVLLAVASFLLEIFIFISGSAWIGIIFTTIFVGGIMIMFMVLSSLLPNEKVKKANKASILFVFIPLLFNFCYPYSMSMENSFNFQSKIVFFSNGSFETVMLVILMYFLIFVHIISKQNVSLRSYLC